MSTEIKTLKPQAVWEYFYDLTQIPRPTGQMDEVTKYVFDFGKRLGLETEQDGQCHHSQAGHTGHGKQTDRDPPIALGYGASKEFGHRS